MGCTCLRQVTTPRMALALSIGAAGALWVIFRADLAALLAFDVGRGEVIFFWGCVAHALYAPIQQIVDNAGQNGALVVDQIKAQPFDIGYDRLIVRMLD